MDVIKIENLSVSYDVVEALKHININIQEKEFLGIIGPNGGGKSTLVKTIVGRLKPKSGSIKIKNGQTIGYVPQFTTFDKNFAITVEEVILIGHLPKKLKFNQKFSEGNKNHANRIMERLNIRELANRQIGQLSGGQMQRVLIARALMNHPTILILDEPTAGVDEKAKEDIFKMLEELNREMTIMMITHEPILLLKFLDRVVYINQKSHIHNIEELTEEDMQPGMIMDCPIDWFVKGQKIQKNLIEGGRLK